MSEEITSEQRTGRPLRIWIPCLLIALMLVARFVPGLIQNGPAMIWMVAAFGPMLLGLLIVLWWLLLSRASWKERVVGLVGIMATFAIVFSLLDQSMLGPPIPVITIPMGIGGFAIGVILLASVLDFRRTLAGLILCFLGAGFSTLLKNDGMWGDFAFGLEWRWTPTPEEQFLSNQSKSAPTQANAQVAQEISQAVLSPEWPGFRGPNRDGVQTGMIFSADWKNNPPQELWRIQVGPAWSSFAVAGDYLFTQEQRGDNEAVVCYDANTGTEVWAFSTESRFFDGLGGLGPRATPTIANGSILAMGGEGWLVCLNAPTGELVWKVDIREAANCQPPMWGFSSSPLVTDGVVAVHTGAAEDKGIMAFDLETGEVRWSVAAGIQSYGSLQVITLADRRLVAILSDEGVQLIDPVDGKTTLLYEWQHQGYRALQPQVVGDNGLLIPTGMGMGTRLVEVTASGAGESGESSLSATEKWTSRRLKPDYSDLVIHQGFAYGFDNLIFTCIDLADGERKWIGGRYGKGQAILLSDSDLILVISEKGQLVLLKANPEKQEELATIEALNGKTWNHPVVVGDRLFLRNAAEAVCYRLPIAAKTNMEPSQ